MTASAYPINIVVIINHITTPSPSSSSLRMIILVKPWHLFAQTLHKTNGTFSGFNNFGGKKCGLGLVVVVVAAVERRRWSISSVWQIVPHCIVTFHLWTSKWPLGVGRGGGGGGDLQLLREEAQAYLLFFFYIEWLCIVWNYINITLWKSMCFRVETGSSGFPSSITSCLRLVLITISYGQTFQPSFTHSLIQYCFKDVER